MALTKTTVGVTNIADLSSTPNATEGLTAAQLQAKFDKTGADLKTYINDTLTAELDTEITNIKSGWICSGETWTFVSVDDPTGVIKINADVTTKYSLGMRIKFTNGGNIIYGILTKIGTYGGDTAGYTYLTFLHEIDPTDNLALYLMANSAITLNCYSSVKVPFGFPSLLTHWSILFTDTETRTQNTPTQNTWYNIGTLYLDIPIGSWDVNFKAQTEHERATAGYPSVYCALSTSNNSVSNNNLKNQSFFYSANICSLALTSRDIISLTSKTRYYLIASTDQTDTSTLSFRGSLTPTAIRAICTYL